MLEQIIEFLSPFSDFIKIIGGILAACIALYKTLQKFFAKEIIEKLNDLKEQITDIKTTNQKQDDRMRELISCQDEMRTAEKNLLRTILIAKFYEYRDKPTLPYYEREGLAIVFNDYKRLQGNSFIDHLYEQLIKKESPIE